MPAAPLRSRGASSFVRLASWAAIVWIVVFWRLGYPGLMDPDEAHYAELTREMVHAGSWLVPLLDGQPYIDKPVLFHWLQAAAMAVFGETEMAVRLPSALAALALFWWTRRAGIVLFGESVGEWGAVMLATIPATFTLSSIGLFDMVFTTLLFGGLVSLIEASRRRSRRREIVGYALVSLAVMIKGPVALLLVGLFCAAAWALRGDPRARVGWLRWKTGLACAAAAASPWFVWMFVHFGQAFVQGYVLAGNLYYFTQPASWSSRAVSHVFYLRSFAGGFFPWSVIALGGAFELVRRRASAAADEQLLWLWTLVVVGFFSLARFKLDHYIFPAAPAVCLLAAKAWHDAARGEGAVGRGVRGVVLVLAALLVVAGTFVSVYIFELGLNLRMSAILLPYALALGGVFMLTQSARLRWRLPPTPLVPVATLLAVYAVFVYSGLPAMESLRPTPIVARALRDHSPHDAPAAIYQLEQWRASLRYYAERPLAALSTPEDVKAFFDVPEPRYIIMRRRDYLALREEGVAVHDLFHRHAVVGTRAYRAGLRRQLWGELLIVTNESSRQRRHWLP